MKIEANGRRPFPYKKKHIWETHRLEETFLAEAYGAHIWDWAPYMKRRKALIFSNNIVHIININIHFQIKLKTSWAPKY